MRILFKILISVIVTLIIGIFVLFPILKPFPKPTGPYFIGTQSLYIVDAHRNEPYSLDAKKRALMVRIWYPTSVPQGTTYPYLGTKMPFLQKVFAEFYNIPIWISTLLWCNIKTNSYSNAPIASTSSTYPVILFSHGLLGLPSDSYITIIENLASHGYIVIGIDHSYFNLITQYPDGTIASSVNLNEQFKKMNSEQQYEFQSKAIDTYKGDMKLVIDQLESLNRDTKNIFYNRFDLNRIGIMGHSAGGTAAIEFCRIDNRCKAVADLDGWYDHIIGYEPLEQPLLLMLGSKSIDISEPSPEYLARKDITKDQYYEQEQKIADHRKALCQSSLCSMIVIPDAAHEDFGDFILVKWPIRPWSAANSYKTLTAINTHILEFFNNNLKLQPNPFVLLSYSI